MYGMYGTHTDDESLSYCEPHHWELCHICHCDFRAKNAQAWEEGLAREAVIDLQIQEERLQVMYERDLS